MGNNWAIEFVERPLSEIGIWDNLVYGGKDASHSFLRIKDEDGNIKGELHGFSYDPQKQSVAPANFNPWKRLKHIFSNATDQFKPNTLKVFHYDYHRSQSEDLVSQTIFEGDKEDIMLRWMDAIKEGIRINAEDHEYRALNIFKFWIAQNCHTVSNSLMRVMGLEGRADPVFAAPGLTQEFNTETQSASTIAKSFGKKTVAGLAGALLSWSERLIESHTPEKVQCGEEEHILCAADTPQMAV